MIDASHEPLEKNIEITRRIVDRAHAKGIVVEAELGRLGGVEEDIAGSVLPDRRGRGDPLRSRSGCDSLAVAIGTSHGAYKFAGRQSLHLDRLRELNAALPKGFPMVMHGSSSVPKEWVSRINAAGGKMKDTSGVDENQYLPAAQLGICKVNIDTDGRLVWCATYRESFRDDPQNFDLRPPGQPSWPTTPSTSSTRTRCSAPAASSKQCGRRSSRRRSAAADRGTALQAV